MKRLTEKHPLTQKLRLLEAFLTEHELEIFVVSGKLYIRDDEHEAEYIDAESKEACTELPHLTETTLRQ